MADDRTCNICGGTNFYIEAGDYYCAECQTQSQEIGEHVFATPDETTAARQTSFKRVRTKKKDEDKLTSWECYNYIVLGLVNELVELGADPKLKQNVHFLWFKYLQKLEVISGKADVPPKLGAVNFQRDAEIVYGRSKKKRKRSRTPSPSGNSEISSAGTSTVHRERAKQRRSIILSQYDEFSTQQSEEVASVHNQSLISLKSGSDASKEREKFLQYNKKARNVLLKVMTKNHLKTHCRDATSTLECHKLGYKNFSSSYLRSAAVLCRNKIYALIYVGLLINKDKIQLGDLLRFIREGKLSYHSVHHFFPEEFEAKHLNIKTWNKGNYLTHCGMRKAAAMVAKEIGVARYIPRQNLVQLCQRYCCELNLPDQIWGYALNLMSRAVPRMHFTDKSESIPNYEGRVISVIMFVLKLFFGLDDVTEEKLSVYAKTVNELPNTDIQKMFVWNDWLYFIKYRKLVLMQHHFPTQYLFDNENVQNTDMFINFITEQNLKHERDDPPSREVEVLQHLLEKLVDTHDSSNNCLEFNSTLTPFHDYIETLLDSKIPAENNYLVEVLRLSFKSDSLICFTDPLPYLEELNKNSRVGIKHRGANNDLKIIRIPNFKVKRECWRNATKKEVLVKLSDHCVPDHAGRSVDVLQEEKHVAELSSKSIIKNFERSNKNIYQKRLRKLVKAYEKRPGIAEILEAYSFAVTLQTAPEIEFELSQISSSQQTTQLSDIPLNPGTQPLSASQLTADPERLTYFHYNPYDRHWLKSINVANITKEEFQTFIQTFPDSFLLLLNECARITEQSSKSLFEEFTDVEIYLSYVAEFTPTDKLRNKVVNNDLVRFINKAKKNW